MSMPRSLSGWLAAAGTGSTTACGLVSAAAAAAALTRGVSAGALPEARATAIQPAASSEVAVPPALRPLSGTGWAMLLRPISTRTPVLPPRCCMRSAISLPKPTSTWPLSNGSCTSTLAGSAWLADFASGAGRLRVVPTRLEAALILTGGSAPACAGAPTPTLTVHGERPCR